MEQDYFATAKAITSQYQERIQMEDIIAKQAAVIETLQQMIKVQEEQIALLKEALQP